MKNVKNKFKGMNFCTKCEVWFQPETRCNCYAVASPTYPVYPLGQGYWPWWSQPYWPVCPYIHLNWQFVGVGGAGTTTTIDSNFRTGAVDNGANTTTTWLSGGSYTPTFLGNNLLAASAFTTPSGTINTGAELDSTR